MFDEVQPAARSWERGDDSNEHRKDVEVEHWDKIPIVSFTVVPCLAVSLTNPAMIGLAV